MKMTSKQVGRLAKKSINMQNMEEKKARDALSKGNIDGARIFAENAIRNKSQSFSYLKLQSQLEAMASKVQSQAMRAEVMKDMSAVTDSLGTALGNMDVVQLAQTMDTFIEQSDLMDVQTKFMDSAIGESTSSATPQNEVNRLLSLINDENELNQQHLIDGHSVPNATAAHAAVQQASGQLGGDTLTEARLAALQSRPPHT